MTTTVNEGDLKEGKWCFFLSSIVTFVFLWVGEPSFSFLVNWISHVLIKVVCRTIFPRWGSRWRIWWTTIAWRRESGGASSSPPASPSSPASPAFSSSEHSTQSFAKRWEEEKLHFCRVRTNEYVREKAWAGGRTVAFWLDAPSVQMQEGKKEGGTKRPIYISTILPWMKIHSWQISVQRQEGKVKVSVPGLTGDSLEWNIWYFF